MPTTTCGRTARFVLPSFLALLLVACEEPNTYVEPPPPRVTVALPLVQDVTEYLEFTGRTVPFAYVQVPARVPGVLETVHFQPGSHVDADDLLFSIDPQEYEAAEQAAKAELARAEAREVETQKALTRAETLITRGNISQASLDEASADHLAAKAEVLVRQANLRQAQIDLGYTQVRAPLSGRVGRNLVDVGNLVGQGEATILTDITTYNPMYVYFEVNERDLLRYLERNRSDTGHTGEAASRDDEEIEVGLANEQGYPHKGMTDFAESQVDPDTGTILVRGILDNPGREPEILPGLFSRVRVAVAQRPDMPLVAERAIGFDQSGSYLLVVNSENTVEKRNVTLGTLVDGLRAIEDGLADSDRVVVNGLQRARVGAEVAPEEVDMASLSASALEAALKAEDAASEEGSASGSRPTTD